MTKLFICKLTGHMDVTLNVTLKGLQNSVEVVC